MKVSNTTVVVCLIFNLATAAVQNIALAYGSSENIFCAAGSIEGHPPIVNLPSYDYSDEGLVQFHFRFTQGDWNYNTLRLHFYDDNCNLQTEPGYGQVGGLHLPISNNILVKVVEFFPNKYNFKVYNEETGEFQGSGLGAVPNDFNPPFISFSLTNIGGPYNAPVVDGVTTPVVPLKKPSNPSLRTPILIIPGIMGTQLYKGTSLIWPNFRTMLTDVGDNFLDSLVFGRNLTPVDGSVVAGDLVKQTTLDQHYYDLLINDLVARGYTENLDLFTIPYDWRFGIDDNNLTLLKAKINSILSASGHDKIDVIAHSAGGLLLKKYIYDNGADKIRKAIMAGVPELGAPAAIKALTVGDNLGVPWLSAVEMHKLALNMPMVYDLLPSQEYLETSGSYVHQQNLATATIQNLDFDQTGQWLINRYDGNELAWQRAATLHIKNFDNTDLSALGADAYTIAGCLSDTIGNLTESRLFPEAAPLLSREFSSINGDTTVPLVSTRALQHSSGKTFYAPQAEHGKLLSYEPTRNLVVKIVTEDPDIVIPEGPVTQNPSRCSIIVDQNTANEPTVTVPNTGSVGDVNSSLSTIVTTGSQEPANYLTPAASPGGGATPASQSLPNLKMPEATVHSPSPHLDGTLINDQGTVYLLEYGQKRPFRSWGEFQSNGYSLENIKIANDDDRVLREGPPILVKAQTIVLVPGKKKHYYLINERGEKQLFVSERAMTKRGYKTRQAIKLSNLADYVSGAKIYQPQRNR